MKYLVRIMIASIIFVGHVRANPNIPASVEDIVRDLEQRRKSMITLQGLMESGMEEDRQSFARAINDFNGFGLLNYQSKLDGETLLTFAVKWERAAFVELLMQQPHLKLRQTNERGETAMSILERKEKEDCDSKDVQKIRRLLDAEIKRRTNAHFMIRFFNGWLWEI